MTPHVQWAAPSQLRGSQLRREGTAAFTRPVLLRFTSDTFMDDLQMVLEKNPAHLEAFVAQPETWLAPTPTPRTDTPTAAAIPKSMFSRGLERLREAVRTSGDKPAHGEVAIDPPLDRTPKTVPLKLYQPAHQRYYLVTASLVCRVLGLPDRLLRLNQQERAAFVVRRILPPAGVPYPEDTRPADPSAWDEYAFVNGPQSGGWQKISATTAGERDLVMPGEELLPLFTLDYSDQEGHRRQLFGGLVPVGKRDAYMGAAPYQPGAVQEGQGGTSGLQTDPRLDLFNVQVAGPWKALIEQANGFERRGERDPTLQGRLDSSNPSDEETQALLKTVRERIQTGSWYVLLDLATYLEEHLPHIWDVIARRSNVSALRTQAERDVLKALEVPVPPVVFRFAFWNRTPYAPRVFWESPKVRSSLIEALRSIVAHRDDLEQVSTTYDRERPDVRWPPFLFPLTDPSEFEGSLSRAEAVVAFQTKQVDKIGEAIEEALPVTTETRKPATSLAADQVMDFREGWFLIRCVFERPACGPLEGPIVSDPTDVFQLAGFFDPDAPARRIRITLPIDTTPAGLRKFSKNAAFLIPDVLCGQIDSLKGLTLGDLVRSVLPWPLHKDLSASVKGPCTSGGNPAGMMCSLSIPIVTICAMILLMVIVNLLDFIFRWIPYFITCFPLPGFKAKR